MAIQGTDRRSITDRDSNGQSSIYRRRLRTPVTDCFREDDNVTYEINQI